VFSGAQTVASGPSQNHASGKPRNRACCSGPAVHGGTIKVRRGGGQFL